MRVFVIVPKLTFFSFALIPKSLSQAILYYVSFIFNLIFVANDCIVKIYYFYVIVLN